VPHLKELLAKHEKDGLAIVGVHSTKGGDKMAEFVKAQKIPWPNMVDKDKKTQTAFAVDSFPDYYLVDRAGKLRFADLANKELDRAVTMLLKESPPADLVKQEPATGEL